MSKGHHFDKFDVEETNFPPTYVVEETYEDGKLIDAQQIARFKYPLDGVMFLNFIEKCYEGEDDKLVYQHKFTIYMDDDSKYGVAVEDDLKKIISDFDRVSEIMDTILRFMDEDEGTDCDER